MRVFLWALDWLPQMYRFFLVLVYFATDTQIILMLVYFATDAQIYF